MDNEVWWGELEAKLFTIFKTRMSTKYPSWNIHYTTDAENQTPTQFPTIYFHEVDQRERGNDLENFTINGVIETIEISITHNGYKKELRSITNQTVLEMKRLEFFKRTGPVYLEEAENIRRSIMRFERVIGASDSFV